MPIYEYECAKCGKVEEAWQKFSDEPLTTCKYCGGSVRKLISQSSFHLKGSGWYVTDYAKKTSGGDSTPKKAEAKTETKTETKTESKAGSASASSSAD